VLIDWDGLPQAQSIRIGAERKFVTGQHSSVVHVSTQPDADFDGRPHRHPHEQWIVVTAGRLQISCADNKFDLSAGDVVFVPSHVWHAAVGVGPEGATYLEFSSPPRLDLVPHGILPSALEFPPERADPRTNES
jgi:mannose-6-phosphate isomerase-like protein (cupin superfamily)